MLENPNPNSGNGQHHQSQADSPILLESPQQMAPNNLISLRPHVSNPSTTEKVVSSLSTFETSSIPIAVNERAPESMATEEVN